MIIEYQGDYWHANPSKYNSGDFLNIIGKGKVLVDDIWARDALKKELAEKCGFVVKYIWEAEFKANGMEVLALCIR